MGRPSLLELTFEISAETLTRASIAGDAVVVSEGTISARGLADAEIPAQLSPGLAGFTSACPARTPCL